METFLAGKLDEIFVGADTGGLEGLGAQLLILVRHQVDAQGEIVDGGTLSAEVEDANLGVRHTTVEPRLRIRLEHERVSKTDASDTYQHLPGTIPSTPSASQAISDRPAGRSPAQSAVVGK